MSQSKTTAEAMAELNRAFRELWDVIVAVYTKAAKDITAAWRSR